MEVQTLPQCFGCGLKNPIGLKLQFEVEPTGVARSSWTPGEWYQGYPGIVHGGILSTLLDEIMVKAIQGLGITAVTAKLEATFRRPVPLGEKLYLTGWVEKRKGKKILTSGEIRNKEGQLFAQGRGLFVVRTQEM